MEVNHRTFKIEKYDDLMFEVIEIVRTSRNHKVKVGCGLFGTFDAAADYIRFTFGSEYQQSHIRAVS